MSPPPARDESDCSRAQGRPTRMRRTSRYTQGASWLAREAVIFSALGAMLTTNALAGGYDTPMLYSARHIGMGGTAVSNVDDASALFHNPAGLAHIPSVGLLADFSLLAGSLQGSPAEANQNIRSDTTVAPFFLVGAGLRLTDWLSVGAAIYPVASAGGRYEYTQLVGINEQNVEDKTKLIFVEAALGVAIRLAEPRLTFGLGYRVTYVNLTRATIRDGSRRTLDFSMNGLNFLGLRAGIQWAPIEHHLRLGLAYRHKTITSVSSNEAIAPPAFAPPDGQVVAARSEFTLPSRLVFGVRGDLVGWGASFDLEYGLNSQNVRSTLSGTRSTDGGQLTADNVFAWENAFTFRFGVEYSVQLGDDLWLRPRAGFILDLKTSNPSYPSAFGTPPSDTKVFTAGAGFDFAPYAVGVAYAYRFGGTRVSEEDLRDGQQGVCLFCSQPGDYKLQLHGVYVDVSYELD